MKFLRFNQFNPKKNEISQDIVSIPLHSIDLIAELSPEKYTKIRLRSGLSVETALDFNELMLTEMETADENT